MDVSIRTEGQAGRITLTRPAALNALSYGMVQAIDAALVAWADDPAVRLVIIDAEGPRAFCAGGDVAAVYHMGRAGDVDGPRHFWRDEYRMNARIAEYPKPIVAFMQGFVMGGGVGLGCHAQHRIIGESTQMAMPETLIGLIPDVGGTHLLARAPGRLGEYLGLTGARMGPGDALAAGFADHFLPEASWPALKEALIHGGDPDALKDEHTADAPLATPLADARDQIDALFCGADLSGILTAVSAATSDFATATAASLRRMSPLSMAATLALVRGARVAGTIRAALTQEFNFTARATRSSDFLEGVRAQLIDKDRQPRWQHASGAEVTEEEVAALLAPLGPEWAIW
ncbi:enoyl-CoA hydratase/isomerase family protein [Phaeovulum sp. W22_SRMD_FR3]|uniref:enoyl-CoA hydratase/isomerase family protein n=1 Tax=Phaeovulum sp. W22_SRMD_FR3 TaxID=3240274 RepID=UPI003F9C9017